MYGHLLFYLLTLPVPQLSRNECRGLLGVRKSKNPSNVSKTEFLFGIVLPIPLGKLGFLGKSDPVAPSPPDAAWRPLALAAGSGREAQRLQRASRVPAGQVPLLCQ